MGSPKMTKSAKSKASSKEKKLARKNLVAAAQASPVQLANKKEDILSDFVAFTKYERNGVAAQLEFYTSESIPDELRAWCFDLLKANMEETYAEDWSDREKRAELKDDEARFLVMKNKEDSEPLAFVHLRFVYEEEIEVLYVYEVQVSEALQRKGVGKFLMQLCELIARKNDMKGVMLTCFKNNPSALAFYLEKLKYVIDPISPSYVNPLAADEYTYEIISKIFCAESKKALKKRADEARAAWMEEELEEMVMKKAEKMGKATEVDEALNHMAAVEACPTMQARS